MSSREMGTLPIDTEKNPKEEVKAVELRSGKIIEGEKRGEKESEPGTPRKTAGKSSDSTQPPTSQSNIVIPPPFPATLEKAKLDSQFDKFLELFKKLNINIPFADALMQMPSYAKFLKEILSNKRKLEEHAMISLTENCSALVQNKIPPKQKIQGVSLSLVLLMMKLNLGEPKSTRIGGHVYQISQMIIEDVQVKVDKFIFPVDFVVLDMEEDLDMPLILGRPFLATGKALIDVQKGELHLRVGEEKISFDVFKALKFSQINEECFHIDVVDSLLYDFVQDTLQEPLESALISPPRDDLLNSWRKGGKLRLEDLGDRKDLVLQKPSLEEPPTVELKPLPTHLNYVFLGEMEARLLDVLKSRKSVFSWKEADIKGINPFICMHKILMEENFNPLCMGESSSMCSEKGGITVIKNEQNELIPTRTVTGWRVCIDYRKLNDTTRKDHFPLPFIDQMLERLAGCLPFGIYNAPATFQRCMAAIFHDMVENILEIFMDDFSIFGQFFDHRCVAEGEKKNILSHCHDREVGGHVGPIKTASKVLECGFYWPNIFKDACAYVIECDRCQQTDSFTKKYILVAVDYVSKWVEAEALATNDAQVVLKVLKKNIFNRFGEKRLLELNQSEEFRDQAYDMAVSYKERTKRIHDRCIRHREFKEEEAVLLLNSRLRLFPGKLKSRWSGPYKITKVYPSGAIEITDARNECFKVNAQRLKHYVGGDVDSTPVITSLTDQD
ncbi:uncharacterized protein [Henckelia pumila]|uniref:uncharacterized protein n=1 Tax=Henckelia pumila TaxID=405737 RepID=UPI003C6DEB1F